VFADGAVEHFPAKWKRAYVVAALEIWNAGIVFYAGLARNEPGRLAVIPALAQLR
jgi:hypothetical protein